MISKVAFKMFLNITPASRAFPPTAEALAVGVDGEPVGGVCGASGDTGPEDQKELWYSQLYCGFCEERSDDPARHRRLILFAMCSVATKRPEIRVKVWTAFWRMRFPRRRRLELGTVNGAYRLLQCQCRRIDSLQRRCSTQSDLQTAFKETLDQGVVSLRISKTTRYWWYVWMWSTAKCQQL